ncbi:MAG: hypothetical protein K0R46_1612 [Herbinix sp.]|jgi:predicted NBD/HSP70 family sugar kinase|nr:hypothetical protein [Herbinix sp.]
MDKLVFDIGATNTKFALMNVKGEILAREKIPTNYESVDAFLGAMVQIVDHYRSRGDEIAISTNGRMCPDGNTYRAYTMRCLQGLDLKKEMEALTGLPVTILNDGFSAALGEWWQGAGQGSKNLLVLVLGSGMGAGLILGGTLYQGTKLNAAMVFGMVNSYGNNQYDLSAMTTTFALLLYQLAARKGLTMEEMTGQRFFDFIDQGDLVALEMLESYCESIAGIIYNSALLLDLDHIVVTGGLSSRDIVMETINRKLTEIPEKALLGQAAGLLEMVAADKSDFLIQAKKGSLALDANIYGALYYLLTKNAATIS